MQYVLRPKFFVVQFFSQQILSQDFSLPLYLLTHLLYIIPLLHVKYRVCLYYSTKYLICFFLNSCDFFLLYFFIFFFKFSLFFKTYYIQKKHTCPINNEVQELLSGKFFKLKFFFCFVFLLFIQLHIYYYVLLRPADQKNKYCDLLLLLSAHSFCPRPI